MQSTLQDLTDKLYNEGLAKGKDEAQRLVSEAKAEAKRIVEAADAEAAEIVKRAKKLASDEISMAENDLKLSSVQVVNAIRQKIENSVLTKSVKIPVTKAFSDTKFVKELIMTIVKAFKPDNASSVDLEVLLPVSLKQQIGDSLEAQVKSDLSSILDVKGVKGLTSGFKIGPKDGGYQISFTGEEFSELISEYLRPATKKILFE